MNINNTRFLVNRFDRPQPEDMDDRYHHLCDANILHTLYISHFLDMIADVPGDVVECGVGRGRSLVITEALMRFKRGHADRDLYGYDSFEGFPEPAPEDVSPRKPKKGEWSHSPSGEYEVSLPFIQEILQKASAGSTAVSRSEGHLLECPRTVKLVKGYFCDTLPHHPNKPIALLNVDGDLYDSYKDTLQALYPLVAPGGVILFDDFLVDSAIDAYPGARKAVEEFFEDKPGDLQVSPIGTAYYRKAGV